jgi:hypothetical protein
MAIDTAARRSAVIGWGLAALSLLPLPTGSVSQAERQQAQSLYNGVLAQSVSTEGHRASAIGWGNRALSVLPIPTGSIDQPARQQTVAIYDGILAQSPTPPGPASSFPALTMAW